MSFGSIANYQGSGEIERLVRGTSVYVKAYNSTGSAIVAGKVVRLFFVVDTATDPDCARLDIGAVLENAAAAEFVGVVDNSPKGLNSIAASAYGWVCIQGQVEAYGGATVAANQQIEVLSTADEFTDAEAASSAARVIEAAGVAIDALADGTLSTVYLFGVPCATPAS